MHEWQNGLEVTFELHCRTAKPKCPPLNLQDHKTMSVVIEIFRVVVAKQLKVPHVDVEQLGHQPPVEAPEHFDCAVPVGKVSLLHLDIWPYLFKAKELLSTRCACVWAADFEGQQTNWKDCNNALLPNCVPTSNLNFLILLWVFTGFNCLKVFYKLRFAIQTLPWGIEYPEKVSLSSG